MYALVNGRCDLLFIIWSKFQQMHPLFFFELFFFYKHIKTCYFLIIFSLLFNSIPFSSHLTFQTDELIIWYIFFLY